MLSGSVHYWYSSIISDEFVVGSHVLVTKGMQWLKIIHPDMGIILFPTSQDNCHEVRLALNQISGSA